MKKVGKNEFVCLWIGEVESKDLAYWVEHFLISVWRE